MSVAENVAQSTKGSALEATGLRQQVRQLNSFSLCAIGLSYRMVQVVDAITESGGEVDYVVLVAPDSLDDVTGLIESPVIMV